MATFAGSVQGVVVQIITLVGRSLACGKIPSGSLIAAKTGNIYKCSKTTVGGEFGQVTAKFDLDKCTFTISMKGADLDVTSGDLEFGINFTDFGETDDITLP